MEKLGPVLLDDGVELISTRHDVVAGDEIVKPLHVNFRHFFILVRHPRLRETFSQRADSTAVPFPTAAAAVRPQAVSGRILLVEDDAVVRATITSSRAPENPMVSNYTGDDSQFEQAFTQPVGWQRALAAGH